MACAHSTPVRWLAAVRSGTAPGWPACRRPGLSPSAPLPAVAEHQDVNPGRLSMMHFLFSEMRTEENNFRCPASRSMLHHDAALCTVRDCCIPTEGISNMLAAFSHSAQPGRKLCPHPRELLDAVALQHLALAVPQPRGQRARLPARQPLVHAAQRRAPHVLQQFSSDYHVRRQEAARR